MTDDRHSLEMKAYRIWLEFSRADQIELANLRDGRQVMTSWDRWEKMVSWKVKQQFMDEARYGE